MDFLSYLVKRGIIEAETSGKIAGIMKESGKDSFDILLEQGIDKENLLSLKSDYLNIPFKSVTPQEVSPEVLRHIPEESALHYGFVPIGLTDGVLEVGMLDPDKIFYKDSP